MFSALRGFLFTVVVCLAAIGCDDSHPTVSGEHTDSLGRAMPASVTNDSELLIYRCGKPDKVLDTSWDNPRPPIPSRLLTYRKAHLKIAYLPSGAIGEPPPYHWKFMGLIDTRNNSAVSADRLKSTLQQRLPCMLSNPQ